MSPGSVKEKAHLLNKMATESDLVPKQPYVPSRRREHRDDKVNGYLLKFYTFFLVFILTSFIICKSEI